MNTTVVIGLLYGFSVIVFCLWLAHQKPTPAPPKLFPKKEK